jgi:hypothetical protein
MLSILFILYMNREMMGKCKRRQCCDNTSMSIDNEPVEKFPIAHSTAYLGLAALLTIRDNTDDEYDDEATRYAAHVLNIIKATPETVLSLEAVELEDVGPYLLDNSPAWLNDA